MLCLGCADLKPMLVALLHNMTRICKPLAYACANACPFGPVADHKMICMMLRNAVLTVATSLIPGLLVCSVVFKR